MRRASAIALAAAFVASGSALGVVAARGPAAPRTMDDRVRQIASTLRCPSCQDLSVADSPSIVARQIRADIATRLRDGQSPRQIRGYFESRFGQSILLTPAAHGIDLLAWVVPGLLVLAGLGLLGLTLIRWSRPKRQDGPDAAGVELSPGDRALLEREVRSIDVETT